MKVKWIFNRWMLFGAVLGWFIMKQVFHLQATYRHKGAGVVTSYAFDPDGSYSDLSSDNKVPEETYKRHHYIETGGSLLILLWLWCVVAYYARKEKNKDNRVSE